ncbi:MAG TPA: hypothetical protein K8V81_00890 [Brachybacterium massiliense]|uniref:Uncharacterized protein n=1 Tax=Brachybacterium massiliense TaxID=1755098 RepID=A0A921MU65_9MICO|nr:hypothetical protein [Actinomycetales bacterium]HJG90257.1 hypothetical protein [Brachybacterium massiliense]
MYPTQLFQVGEVPLGELGGDLLSVPIRRCIDQGVGRDDGVGGERVLRDLRLDTVQLFFERGC